MINAIKVHNVHIIYQIKVGKQQKENRIKHGRNENVNPLPYFDETGSR